MNFVTKINFKGLMVGKGVYHRLLGNEIIQGRIFIETGLAHCARVTLPLEAGVYPLPNHEVMILECAQ